MSALGRALRLGLAAAVAAGLLPALETAGRPAPAGAFPGATVDLAGHGYGHGRGMGQFGALGYSLQGWGYEKILDHYYGGTKMATLAEPEVTVELTRLAGGDLIVAQERGNLVTNAAPEATFQALRAVRIGTNRFRVDFGTDCGGGPAGWKVLVPSMTGPVTFSPQVRNEERAEMVHVCEPPNIRRWVRGQMEAWDGNGKSRAVNRLPMDGYLKGVVPRESPASWGTQGGGAGMHALRAQAVAARSYAATEKDTDWAQTCDTVMCQVYGGRAEEVDGTFRDLEAATTNRAVDETAGQIRVFTATGKPARTEFSSSTGGYTAGGTFPPVPDLGDAVASNPSRNWTARVPVEVLEAARPGIGRLLSVDVTKRNGLGDWGGRVLEVQLRGTEGRATLTGTQLRMLYPYSSKDRPAGLRSDWFQVLNNPSGGVSGYWVAAPDGGIFAFGEAGFYGSTGAMVLNRPVVGMAATPSGKGYWLVASDGGIFAFGDAGFFGSTGAMTLNQPIVGMAPTPSGDGYWLVASDGGIFAFGDAGFFGSTGAIELAEPVMAMAARPDGAGYWLVARDGGIFAFGDAGFHGSLPEAKVAGQAAAMRPTLTGEGYLIVTATGSVVNFGDAPSLGDVPTAVPAYRGGVVALDVKATPPGA